MEQTGAKVVVIGAVLGVIESIADFFLAEYYAGEVFGVEVTVADVLMATGIGLVFALTILGYMYYTRDDIDRTTYIFAAIMALAGLILGGIFSNIIVLAGAIVGYLKLRE